MIQKRKKKSEDRIPGSGFGLQVGLGTAPRAATVRESNLLTQYTLML